MSMKYLLIALLIMAIASFIPRVIPMVLIRKKVKSKFFKSFLFYMPYAVLAALTFPSIFYSTGDIITASIGTGVALILSLFINKNFYIVALICVALVFGIGFLF